MSFGTSDEKDRKKKIFLRTTSCPTKLGSHCVKVPERLLAEQEVMITVTSKCFFPLWLEVETEASIEHEKIVLANYGKTQKRTLKKQDLISKETNFELIEHCK